MCAGGGHGYKLVTKIRQKISLFFFKKLLTNGRAGGIIVTSDRDKEIPQMTTFTFNPTAHKNFGIAVEHGVCACYGIERIHHDNGSYNKGSDLCVGHMAMSIKASRFSLMSATLCGGCEDFDGIWAIYEANTHSNCFVYGAKNGVAYIMTLAEFKLFVYTFCTLARESKQNGGGVKIRCRAESKKMIDWLNMRVVA